ncbi:hypothetical protein [Geomonas propionica]|uniref:Uncharacterized protein n=1 Tax=Geomonas propionica TaxID=2798582 RepID=A0ABS0YQI5_9BACT|nr:hypothetical protein [Geomonas propionica]MBJ6799717.1 hypothetical protein [Geomonas propionica]
MGRMFYLREVSDFSQGLLKVTRSARRRGIDLFAECPPEYGVMRLQEILVCEGGDSPLYQELLRRKQVRSIVQAVCSERIRGRYLQDARGTGWECFEFLYLPETYLDAGQARQLQKPSLLPACRTLLEQYRNWWLLGNALEKNDLHDRFEKTGVLDPIEDITRSERDRFDVLLRALNFSLLLVSRFPAEAPLLRSIAESSPFGVPSFAGDDLWLQREAALLWYDLKGFEGLLYELPRFRSTLFYYIHLKRGFTVEQLRELLIVASMNSFMDDQDPYMVMQEWIEEELGSRAAL